LVSLVIRVGMAGPPRLPVYPVNGHSQEGGHASKVPTCDMATPAEDDRKGLVLTVTDQASRTLWFGSSSVG